MFSDCGWDYLLDFIGYSYTGCIVNYLFAASNFISVPIQCNGVSVLAI